MTPNIACSVVCALRRVEPRPRTFGVESGVVTALMSQNTKGTALMSIGRYLHDTYLVYLSERDDAIAR